MLNQANTITAVRLLFFIIFLYLIQYLTNDNVIFYLSFLFVIFLMDCFDGYIARRYNQETIFGAFFDIYSDRIIESLLWVVFYFNGFVGVEVIIVVLIRLLSVDLIRLKLYLDTGVPPFKQLKYKVSELFVSNKLIKFTYGALKLWTFGLLLFFMSFDIYEFDNRDLFVVNISVYLTIVLMIARGLPVVIEYGIARWKTISDY